MAHRTKGSQEKHDKKVAEVANYKKQQGYKNILADLPDHSKPPKLNGHIPDVYAELIGSWGTTIHIVEVETQVGDDTDQHAALQRWAIANGGYFEVVMA